VATFGYDGIGFVVSKEDDFCGLDLDGCRNPETGAIENWAMEVITAVESYTEVSPSETGIRIFAKAELPPGRRKGGHFEIYDDVRFFTVTGKHLKDTPLTVEPRQKELEQIYFKAFPPPETEPQKTVPPPSNENLDEAIIERAFKAKNGAKFKLLWEGNTAGYPSQSEADLALCTMLAFWMRKNPTSVDRLFRKSKLFRPKWDKSHSSDGKTYGEMTVEKAIARVTEVYKPKVQNASVLESLTNIIEAFHSPLSVPYVTVPLRDHFETWPLYSDDFGNWVSHVFMEQTQRLPKPSEFNDLYDILAYKAALEGPEYEVYTRVATYGDEVYLDLCNADREVVKITNQGWSIVKEYPVKFRRKPGMLPLPNPESGGSLKRLRRFLNTEDKRSFILSVSWLVGTLLPTGTFPILIVTGTQGSAKSCFTKLLRNLIDPSTAPLRSLPPDERNLAITANNSLIIALDNVSYLRQWLSDSFCRLASGSGFAVRKLYEDEEEVIFNPRRPIAINGIEISGHNHDLVDRSVSINLPVIEDADRIPERKFWERFERKRPGILGALCDAVSTALRELPSLRDRSYPRLADFAQWVEAAEPSLPWKAGRFLKCYEENRATSASKSINADIVAQAVMLFMDGRGKWTGTATELLGEIEGDPKRQTGYVSERTMRSEEWPKVPHAFSRRLKRASNFLAQAGIRIKFGRTADERQIIIKAKDKREQKGKKNERKKRR